MSLEPVPNARNFSFRAPLNVPARTSRRVARAEEATYEDLVFHDLELLRAEVKSSRELAANTRLLQAVVDSEMDFYDKLLPRAGMSLVKQEILSDRLNRLGDMNDDVIARYRR